MYDNENQRKDWFIVLSYLVQFFSKIKSIGNNNFFAEEKPRSSNNYNVLKFQEARIYYNL